MNHIIAGYLIIEPVARPHWTQESKLPITLLTATDCICSVHPGEWGLAWTSSPDDVEAIKAKLGLSSENLAAIQNKVQELFDAGQYGLPNVFSTYKAAKRFKEEHLQVLDCQIVRLSLPEPFLAVCIDEMMPEGNLLESGYLCNLKKKVSDPNSGQILGYEVLCWDTGAFHSFICNGLEKDYEEKLGLKLNPNGLFDDLESAVQAVDYTNREDVGAEPGYWAPFRLSIEK